MKATARTAIIRAIWALTFLLLAVFPFVADVLGFTDFVLIWGVFVTPLCLGMSEIIGISAVTKWSSIADVRKRRVSIWALISIFSALATTVYLLTLSAAFSTPYCEDPLTADGCALGLGILALYIMAPFVVLSVIGTIVATVIALADTARTSRWVWFAGILTYLALSLIASGLVVIPLGADFFYVAISDWLWYLQVLSPLFLAVITLIYSFTARAPQAGVHTVAS
jgi:hypothetical protein